MKLDNFFYPRSVAVVGASNDMAKIGRQILDNVITGGFKGAIYPINLKEKRIAGLKAYGSLDLLPKPALKELLVVIAIPAPYVVEEVKRCGRLGIKDIVIITAGFKESDAAGKEREEALAHLAHQYKLNVLGPNCLGFINTWHKLNASFAKADTKTGNTALLSQSGAIGSAALDWLKLKDFNFAYFLSLGNKAVMNENDLIAHLAKDKKIELIVCYLEEIADGKRFCEIVSRLAKYKPVAVLKAGQSAAGGELARSHTGSMAGSNAAVRAGIERAGAIWLENLGDLFNLLLLFRKESWQNTGDQSLYIVTNAGGVAVLTADEVERQKAPFAKSLDLLGDADASRYQAAISKLLADKAVNNLLVLLTPQTVTEPEKTAEAIIRLAKRYPHKLIMTSFVGGEAVAASRDLFEKSGLPSFDFPEEAVRSFSQLLRYKMSAKLIRPYGGKKIIKKTPITKLDYISGLRLLESYGIDCIKTDVYDDSKAAYYRYPVVMKASGPDFLHKSDKGAVRANITSAKDLRLAAQGLKKAQSRAFKKEENQIYVQPQAAGFQELILGFKRDASFGPLIIVGQGGIYTEIYKDMKVSLAGLDMEAAKQLISGLRIYPILKGARGQEGYDLKALAEALVRLSKLACEHEEIKELDINPFFLFRKGGKAADVRIII